jgi:hypothetical protein
MHGFATYTVVCLHYSTPSPLAAYTVVRLQCHTPGSSVLLLDTTAAYTIVRLAKPHSTAAAYTVVRLAKSYPEMSSSSSPS